VVVASILKVLSKTGQPALVGTCMTATVSNVLFKALTHRTPLRVHLARKFAKQFSLFSYEERLSLDAVERAEYGFCIVQAARLASLLRYPRISVLEFGCGGGRGLLYAEAHIAEVMKLHPVEIELYGFDNGSGLPRPTDYRDMPHYFRPGSYRMDRPSLERQLKRAKLVIGDVKDTCSTFMQKYDPAPIGCVFHDLDFYSSTRDALTLFDADTSRFLPRVFMYFDDIVGNNTWLCNEFTGERLAIEEFNQQHKLKKICKNYYLPRAYPNAHWTDHIYIHHDFEHSRYNDFVAEREQIDHEDSIQLT
jgi:hypothetical protein